MKYFLFLSILLLTVCRVTAQAPQLLNFQGVARNTAGNVIAAQNIAVRLTIRDNTATGTALYSETRLVATNAFGLFNIIIGSTGATNVTGSMATVNWAANPKFLQVEIDATGGPNFTALGTSRLVSTPYALYAASAHALGQCSGRPYGQLPCTVTGQYCGYGRQLRQRRHLPRFYRRQQGAYHRRIFLTVTINRCTFRPGRR